MNAAMTRAIADAVTDALAHGADLDTVYDDVADVVMRHADYHDLDPDKADDLREQACRAAAALYHLGRNDQ